MKLKKTYPLERFSVKNVGNPASSIWLKKSKYYRCSHCNTRTLVRCGEISPFANKKTPPDFDAETRKIFDNMGRVMSFSVGSDRMLNTYDFFCKGCNRPVRLLYDEQEQGMGGLWHGVIHQIIEQV